ncbi:MAG: SUMF1/EgtB/PvdO family nonheme iron enzyme, partial [Kiritimatiellae bacterium]|nr:SUMF1/EgtB/PvdO family nonheme iron enzyme [Kiritimatiellia bacterium]
MNDGKEYELGWLPNLNDRDGTGNRVVAVSALQRTLGKGVVDIEYEIEGNAVDEEWLEVELVADVIVNGTALRIGALSGEVTAAAGVHQMTWDSGADWPGLDAGNVVIRLTIMPKMSELWHVSPTGDDHADGKSWATAKKTLQTVVEEAVDGETILVAPGTYGAIAPGNKSITIRGVGGAEETILDGGGSACVVLCEGSNPVMIGLTLQNGYAVGGGGANHGTFHNCIIRDNVARDDGGGVWKSICHSCLITGNYATDSGGGSCGGGAYGSKLYNCTVVGNRCFNQTNSQWGAGIAWCLAYNCIIYNNTLDSGVINNYTKSTNYYTCTTPKASGTGNITNAPLFVDAIHGDYRLERISPCINAGSNGYVAVLTDLAGNQRIASTVDMGAFECGAVGVYSPVNVPSEYVVSGAKASAIAVYTRDSDEDGLYDAWERGEGRYEVVEFEGTWEEARADAEARGGHLATITSEAEWVAISNLFGAKLDGCWLGGSDEEEEGVWTWVTGEPWAYTRWDSGQPDNKFSTQDYLAIQNNLNWDDGVMDLVGQKYLFEFGVYTDPLNEDTDGDGVPDGEEYELGRSPVVNEADGTANEIVSVVCRQRWPWNGLVDIDYEISGWGTNEADFVVVLQGTATIGEQTVELRTLSGEVTAAAGWHRMTWDSTVDWGEDEVAEATVKLEIVTPYLSVDMSGGKDASNWPITPMKNIPEGGWTTDDKTTRMVLRRIEAGTFMMGSPEAEQGRMSTREDLRSVTLTKPYYIGVFEVTQRQWELAMGSNPSQYTGDARPVERVNYNMIRGTSRGAFWPENGAYSPAYAVDGTSFVWKVRTETGLMLDLPTEAQWERACRAGTQSALYSGQELTALDTCSNVAAIARYAGNISEGTGGYGEGHTMVGSFDPNGWGLYDMNGNVWEVCLDWYAESLGTEAAMDPLGPTNGTMRTYRGGSWHDQASACRSATRSATLPTKIGDNDGLRLVCPAGTQSSVESVAFTLDGRAGREVFAGVVGIGVDGVTWSSEWEDGGTGARALVSEDGVAMWSEIGEGSGTWTPLTAGTRELTHQVWLEGTTVGETLRATFEITKGDQSIVFPAIGVQWATNEVTLGARASSGLNVAYEVTSGPGVVENGMLRFTGPGVVTVTARQEGDDNWNAAVAVSSVATVRVVPTEVVLSDLVQTFNGVGGVVTVETVPEGVTVRVTYEGEEEAPVHAGEYAVRVETADARFTGSVDGVLRVAKASQGIVFSPVGSPAWTNRVTLGATAQSGLGVIYTVVSGPGSVSGNVLTFSGPGLVRVEASQAGNEDWEAAESVTLDVEVVKATARVSIGDLEQVYDRETKGVSTGTIPEGLRVLVTYDGTDEAPVGAGSYAVVATVEDTKWEGSATGTLVVAKGSQSIAFDEIGAQGVTNVVALGAAASSGLAMEYVVEGPAVLGEGNVLTFTGVGTVSVTAKQEGGGNWEAAEPVVRVFEVSKGVAVVTLSGLEQVYDGSARVVEAATVPEGLEVEVRYEGSEVAPTNAGRYAV